MESSTEGQLESGKVDEPEYGDGECDEEEAGVNRGDDDKGCEEEDEGRRRVGCIVVDIWLRVVVGIAVDVAVVVVAGQESNRGRRVSYTKRLMGDGPSQCGSGSASVP